MSAGPGGPVAFKISSVMGLSPRTVLVWAKVIRGS